MLSVVISFTRVSMNSSEKMLVWCRLFNQFGGVVCHGSITKEGNRWLRWIMMECASTYVSKYDTWISRSYRCLAGRRGRKTDRVAAARKLLVVCFSVFKHKKPFYDQP
jgi:transposase